MRLFFVYCVIISLGAVFTHDAENNSNNKVNEKSSLEKKPDTLPPCQACRMLANSFKKGMELTSRGKFEGGDASWEESHLRVYADSEIRLVEIQEKLCSDEEKATDQCHRLAEEHESILEEWWFKNRASYPDIFYFLCIDKLQVCCPDNHYGPDCKPCVGGIVNPCNGHGQCKGAGTRKGSGLCRCDAGYTGELCEKCRVGYYYDASVNASGQCFKCDKSCKGHCREGGPKGCEVCADGYQYSSELGCMDFNECLENNPCKHDTFCVNTIGSYRCVECDKSCDGCTGDGPDMCDACASGYTFQDPLCIETKTWQRSVHVEVARYATYLGLCIATCIIFRRSILMAGVIGVCVAIYITLSEYTVGEWDKRSLFKSLRALTSL
ncbi:cysteine-rich with EGF-like domain protein 2-A [Caerostris darwini]|uniref:Cysteine-rich with EGF-like domain protein 2-A n=1 Tax=Caerostris darwini TaxID=1538125 RepID=A0AAV4SES1_9ARAC|nr:cysteine-rich with EGF-like domain protein 2-A [Caerostris darwini]